MSDRVIGDCLVCHSRPEKPIVLYCLHILCSNCINTTEVCPKCRDISTKSVVRAEKACVGCKRNREAVIRCQHCLCKECKKRPNKDALIGCPVCHWICEDCVNSHKYLNQYEEHVLECENRPQEIANEIIECLKNKRQEVSEWKETIERDKKVVLELQRLQHKITKLIVDKMKEIARQEKSNENVIDCVKYIQTFVKDIMPKMTAGVDLKQLMFDKMKECQIVKEVEESNDGQKVLKDILMDIISILGEECETEVKVTNSSQPTANRRKTFSCDKCEREFIRKSGLIEHKRDVHSNERPFVCSVGDCRKRFKRNDHLDAHKLIHSDNKPFLCDYYRCDKSFRFKHHLTVHKKRHLKRKDFKCYHNNCNNRFVTSYELRKHIQSKHCNKRPFRCTAKGCEKTFKTRNNRKRHHKDVHHL